MRHAAAIGVRASLSTHFTTVSQPLGSQLP
jgi:hypothetical protein